jgi:hypothetical protein
MSTAPPPLAADLNNGLKRLKMAAMRRLPPELRLTAKTQCWNPEEFLRSLIEAEISTPDESNARTRMRQAAFPVAKRLDEFDVAASSIPTTTFDYLISLECIRAAERSPAGRAIAGKVIALSPSCRIPETARLGHTLRQWRQQMLACFPTSGVSNGSTEAINVLAEKESTSAHNRCCDDAWNPRSARWSPDAHPP